MSRTSSFGMFSESSDVVINGGYFGYNNTYNMLSRVISDGTCCTSRGALGSVFTFEGWERLYQAVNPAAFYNSVTRKDATRMLPRQYEELLGWAMNWVKDPRVTERILWVHGARCASVLSQSVANFQKDHAVLATYFVNKNPNNLYTRSCFIATLTYQLATFFPRARQEIGRIVTQDPVILSLSVDRQLDTLILNPFEPFLSIADDVTDTPPHPVLIIVDGCDYLDNYTQQCIVDALLSILQQFPSSVRILLSTKSSAMITSLTPSMEHGLVAEIDFSNKRSLRSIIIKIWNKIKIVTRIPGRT